MNNSFQPKFNFYQLLPSIFLLEMDSNQDLAYSFLRAQEFYESVNDKFRDNVFTRKEYMEWYCSQSKSGTFSYGEDWRGFNIPSNIIQKCYEMNLERCPEDDFFLSICEKAKTISSQNGFDSFYLLGVRKGATDVLSHEIAHGLFSTNESYRQEMTENIHEIPTVIINNMYAQLSEIGYGPNVHMDEAQAYISTGLRKDQNKKELKPFIKKFKKTFNSYYKEQVLPQPLIKKMA